MTGRRPESAATDFDAIYAATAPRLVGQLYLLIGDLSEAQDCVQEAFARAWLRWDSLTDGRGDPVGWVKTTAYRLAVSHWRHWKSGLKALRKHGAPADTPGPSPDAVALRAALAVLLADWHTDVLTTEESHARQGCFHRSDPPGGLEAPGGRRCGGACEE